MNVTAIALAAAGFACVLTGWVAYLATIPKGNVPARPIGSILLQLLGTGLAVAGIVFDIRQGSAPSAAVIAPGAFALMMGSTFLLLLTQRKTPVGKIRVKVGDVLMPFAVQAADGSAFHSDSLAGRRILLKFFRGGW